MMRSSSFDVLNNRGLQSKWFSSPKLVTLLA